MTTPTCQATTHTTARTTCSACQTAPATHLITTQAGTSLVCATCRPIDLIPALGPAGPAGESMTAVTQ